MDEPVIVHFVPDPKCVNMSDFEGGFTEYFDVFNEFMDVGSLPVSGWYFWNETWSDRHGPFESKEGAERVLARYCKEVLGE